MFKGFKVYKRVCNAAPEMDDKKADEYYKKVKSMIGSKWGDYHPDFLAGFTLMLLIEDGIIYPSDMNQYGFTLKAYAETQAQMTFDGFLWRNAREAAKLLHELG